MFSPARSMITLTAVLSVALAFSLFGAPSNSSVTSAAEDVPVVARVTVGDLIEITRGDETQPRPSQPQMMNDDGDFWNGWWIIMPIMMVLFWGGVIALVVWGLRQFTRGREQGRSPLDIARERLARGEISKEEFEGIKDDLV